MAAAAKKITIFVDDRPETYTVVKELEGSTHPFLLSRDTDGKQFVLKLPTKTGDAPIANEAHVANEYLAFQLYKAAGCKVPETKLVFSKSKKNGLLEEFINGKTVRELMDMRDPSIHPLLFPAIQRDLVIHGLFANWDINVMGNIMIPFKDDGVTLDYENPYILDCGGTLGFRAQGGIKPYMPYDKDTSLKMTNIGSIMRYAEHYKPMAKLRDISEDALHKLICDRWASVDKASILEALDAAKPKVESIFKTARDNIPFRESFKPELAGLIRRSNPGINTAGVNGIMETSLENALHIDKIKDVLVERMEYLDTYCGKASTTANAGGAGAGAGAASAAASTATTGGGRRKRSKTQKQNRQHKKRASMRRRRTMKK